MWTSTEQVVKELGGGPFTDTDMQWLQRCVVTAHTLVCRWRPDVPAIGSDDAIALGATKLASSLYRRRGSTGADFSEFADMSTPVLPGVIDAETQALLGIGRHHDPVIA